MNGSYADLVAHITRAILSDDDDQSKMLADLYLSSNENQRVALDRAFVCLCGWSLNTLMTQCKDNALQDPTAPEWWLRQEQTP